MMKQVRKSKLNTNKVHLRKLKSVASQLGTVKKVSKVTISETVAHLVDVLVIFFYQSRRKTQSCQNRHPEEHVQREIQC